MRSLHNRAHKEIAQAGSGRSLQLDLLKVLGLLCIMIAHAGPPAPLMFLRSFDVPLMVIAAGAAFCHSARKSAFRPREYVTRRVGRLITPTWAFLTIFFSAAWLLAALTHKPFPFSPEKMLFSYALTLKSGIGYVWIIRVFVLVSVAAPLIYALSKQVGEAAYLTILLTVYCAYEALRAYVPESGSPLLDPFLTSGLYYLLPYGCLFGLGYRLPGMKTGAILSVLSVFLLLFAATTLYHRSAGLPLTPEEYKYPPGLPFVAYGTFASLLLYVVSGRLPVMGAAAGKLVGFISASSLWVYLWHIFFVYAWGLAAPRLNLAPHFPVTLAAAAAFSLGAVYLQKRIIGNVLRGTRLGRKNEELLTALFIR